MKKSGSYKHTGAAAALLMVVGLWVLMAVLAAVVGGGAVVSLQQGLPLSINERQEEGGMNGRWKQG